VWEGDGGGVFSSKGEGFEGDMGAPGRRRGIRGVFDLDTVGVPLALVGKF